MLFSEMLLQSDEQEVTGSKLGLGLGLRYGLGLGGSGLGLGAERMKSSFMG